MFLSVHFQVPVQNIHEDAITPKKKKNKKAKAGSPVAEVVAVEQSAPTSTAEAPVTVQADSGASLSSTVNESDSSISKVPVVQADKASDDKKTSKSPKKKKKGKDLQVLCSDGQKMIFTKMHIFLLFLRTL